MFLSSYVKLFKISENRLPKIFCDAMNLFVPYAVPRKILNPKAKQDSFKQHRALLEAIMADNLHRI